MCSLTPPLLYYTYNDRACQGGGVRSNSESRVEFHRNKFLFCSRSVAAQVAFLSKADVWSDTGNFTDTMRN